MNRYETQYLHLGLNLAYYRKLAGYTQESLAERVNISRNHISKIEATRVKSSMSLDLLFRIADALSIPPSKLLEIRG